MRVPEEGKRVDVEGGMSEGFFFSLSLSLSLSRVASSVSPISYCSLSCIHLITPSPTCPGHYSGALIPSFLSCLFHFTFFALCTSEGRYLGVARFALIPRHSVSLNTMKEQ